MLTDPKKREVYDRYGLKGLQEGGSDGFSTAEDIFSHMFGGGSLFGGLGGFGGGMGKKDIIYNIPLIL